jgi:hypothetical protein
MQPMVKTPIAVSPNFVPRTRKSVRTEGMPRVSVTAARK